MASEVSGPQYFQDPDQAEQGMTLSTGSVSAELALLAAGTARMHSSAGLWVGSSDTAQTPVQQRKHRKKYRDSSVMADQRLISY